MLRRRWTSNTAELPVNRGDDSLPTPPSHDGRPQLNHGNPNENKGFTNSCGEPIFEGPARSPQGSLTDALGVWKRRSPSARLFPNPRPTS